MDKENLKTFNLCEVHQLYLKMMVEYHEYCQENNLQYYMEGGTLLGAVRENGFIPWDDDVDFVMPRPDYEKFIKCYNGQLKIKAFQLDKSFRFPYMKILLKDNDLIRVCDERYKIDGCLQLALDVYPIDGVGNNENKIRNRFNKIKLLRKMCYLNLTSSKSSNLIKNIFLILIRAMPSTFLMRLQVRFMSSVKFETSSFVTRWRLPCGRYDFYKKDVFGKGVKLNFEGNEFIAPTNYDEILSTIYGDYMKPRRENLGLRHDLYNQSIKI
jgi:lipopolysaccharide cholinephosphotransferase